jgi:hypothetical protein
MQCDPENCQYVVAWENIGCVADSLVDAHLDIADANSKEWKYAVDVVAAAIYGALAGARLELMKRAQN